METLVIVDFQKDFCRKNGTLYVDGAYQAEQAIIQYIMKNRNNISDVIFTVDWHSPKHCSFVMNGGQWPAHCIQYSEGAGIADDLIKECIYFNIPFKVFKKGTVDDKEEYGAFEHIGTSMCLNCSDPNGNYEPVISVFNAAHKSQINMDSNNIVVCGIAGDYCVQETIKNLMKYKGDIELNISVFKDGVVSIDGGESFNKFIDENNIKTV